MSEVCAYCVRCWICPHTCVSVIDQANFYPVNLISCCVTSCRSLRKSKPLATEESAIIYLCAWSIHLRFLAEEHQRLMARVLLLTARVDNTCWRARSCANKHILRACSTQFTKLATRFTEGPKLSTTLIRLHAHVCHRLKKRRKTKVLRSLCKTLRQVQIERF
jgi:hypothetical protein